MYYSRYDKIITEIERRQKDRPGKSHYKDADGNTHPASIFQLASYEAAELVRGEKSPIRAYKINEKAKKDNPLLTSIFELLYKHNKEKLTT